jgi:hypothetical protein
MRIRVYFPRFKQNVFISNRFCGICKDPNYEINRKRVRDWLIVCDALSKMSENLTDSQTLIVDEMTRAHEGNYREDKYFSDDIRACCKEIINYVWSMCSGTDVSITFDSISYTIDSDNTERVKHAIDYVYEVPYEITIEK